VKVIKDGSLVMCHINEEGREKRKEESRVANKDLLGQRGRALESCTSAERSKS
jgi:hypothetical protein